MSRTIAIIGANGILGKPTLKALLSEPFASKVKAIKVVSSSGKSPVESDKIEILSSANGYKGLFAGVDAVVNLASPPASANPEIIDAIKEAGVKLYIPSQFGTDLEAVQPDFPGFLSIKTDHSKAARAAGIKTADLYSGLFIREDQTFLGQPLSALDFDAEKGVVEIVGDDNTLINPSFESDIGKVVAALVTRDDYSSIPDFVRFYSGKVTLGDLVAHYEKTTGKKLTKKYTKPEDVVALAKSKYQNFSFDDFLLYLRTFVAQGEGKGLIFENENDREFINPGESLFKWTKYII
ncbi:CYFA0S10e02432g1_1 [Cyberlindnera fabianii]|uniref:CYFA0S10e02432g1_1 n=1 Tax=Cyberlindnera fabianii TaxID=36022 RepID=A0A061B7C5_CYBFA|nr:Isoeugenol synthase 1 [Cyberlindnera fabianii]CDR42802.1 CYFA0S10e02432g1_1 [Cyberlindnera fabianii]